MIDMLFSDDLLFADDSGQSPLKDLVQECFKF